MTSESPAPSVSGSSERYCPSCALRTAEAFCPNDGVATLAAGTVLADTDKVAVGDVIDGRYRVTGQLGSGGFGAVFSAEHTGTRQRVAIKMLRASGASEEEIRRFHREARITASLNHRHTVRVFDVGQTPDGAVYMAMELLRGQTLEDVLRGRAAQGLPLTEAEAIEIAIPVLKSLQEAHRHQLVHRDLKPANVMLCNNEDGEVVVKVLDFGVARTPDSSLTGNSVALGTPAYMSPEQCEGAAIDGRSDLYSLAVILYRCVTGSPPFQHANPLTLMYQHAHHDVPPLDDRAPQPLSAEFVAWVHKALSKRPEDRHVDARQARLELERIVQGNADLRRTAPTAALRHLIARRKSGADADSTVEQLPTESYAATPSAPGVVVVDDARSDDETAAHTPTAPSLAPVTPVTPAAISDGSPPLEQPQRSRLWIAAIFGSVGFFLLFGVFTASRSPSAPPAPVQPSVEPAVPAAPVPAAPPSPVVLSPDAAVTRDDTATDRDEADSDAIDASDPAPAAQDASIPAAALHPDPAPTTPPTRKKRRKSVQKRQSPSVTPAPPAPAGTQRASTVVPD